ATICAPPHTSAKQNGAACANRRSERCRCTRCASREMSGLQSTSPPVYHHKPATRNISGTGWQRRSASREAIAGSVRLEQDPRGKATAENAEQAEFRAGCKISSLGRQATAEHALCRLCALPRSEIELRADLHQPPLKNLRRREPVRAVGGVQRQDCTRVQDVEEVDRRLNAAAVRHAEHLAEAHIELRHA